MEKENKGFDWIGAGFTPAKSTAINDYLGLDYNNLTNHQKRGISILLIGLNQELNEVRTTSPQFHHLESIVKELKITPQQAIKILDDTRGSYSPEKNKVVIDGMIKWFENRIKFDLPPPQTETKTEKIKAPVLGLFCGLIHKIGIDKKEETESASVYCERICNKFKLHYTDRVRQNYNVIETKKLIQELTEKVLPLIDNETKISSQNHLDSTRPPKENLYA